MRLLVLDELLERAGEVVAAAATLSRLKGFTTNACASTAAGTMSSTGAHWGISAGIAANSGRGGYATLEVANRLTPAPAASKLPPRSTASWATAALGRYSRLSTTRAMPPPTPSCGNWETSSATRP